MPRGLAHKTIALRDACYAILEEIQPASVRAVAYQLFNRKLIPNMSKNSTNKVSRILTAAREDGWIPWEWVVDEGRELERVNLFTDPAEYALAVRHSYRRDRWKDQPRNVEVWSEKGTVRGTVKPVLDAYGVGFRVMHGYSSATVLNDVADATRKLSTPLLALYIGDWDPSGMHMSEVDLPSRLREYGANVDLVRVALTEPDVWGGDLDGTEFRAESKRSDSRYQWFVDRHGQWCWELDALNPNTLRDRLEGRIRHVIEWDSWSRHDVAEHAELDSLNELMDQFAAL